ncbi:hypothetical protein [Bacillus subtilis]|uniref:hypothetical protein n=1 Tax=Bacillus subtilis TaxID=1423 RepID=UPI003EBB7734
MDKHNRVIYARFLLKHCFNFTKLNTEASNFHLIIGPAEEFDLAICAIPSQIPCSIQTA